MINDSKEDFSTAINIKADEWRNRSYEEHMVGFLTKTIKQSTTLNIPENVDLGTKETIFKESSATINETAKRIINNALIDEHNTMHDVNVAHEIVNPNSFSESVQKLLAEHIFNEAKDRVDVLEAQFDSGQFNNLSIENTMNYIDHAFESMLFDPQFNNGKELQRQLGVLLSLEGKAVTDSIKNSVMNLITETEAKNSVVRDAVTQINEKREEIEKKINGDSVDPNAESDADVGEAVKEVEEKEDGGEQTTEGFYGRALKRNKRYKKSDLYKKYDMSVDVDLSHEGLSRAFDDNSFSREAAEQILQEFQELDGIDTDAIGDSDDVLSLSDNKDDEPLANDSIEENNGDIESQENTYTDDDGKEIEVDTDKFHYDENKFKAKEPKKDEYDDDEDDDKDDDDDDWNSGDDDDDWGSDWDDEESEESFAKDFMPLSFEKLHHRTVTPTNKFAVYLAFTKDGGELFFNEVRRRATEMYGLLSKEDSVAENIDKDTINKEIEDKVEKVEKIKEDTEKLMNDFGILGILSGTFQRSDSPVHNATMSLFKPSLLTPKESKDISREELHEHELVDILKIGMSITEVKSDIAKGLDIRGNKSKLGYLEELLNEKMFNLEVGEKMEIESKIKALQSIESVIPIEEAISMKVFASKNTSTDTNDDRITISSLKDIDAYGYSFDNEIAKIKKEVEKNYKEKFEGKHTVVNFDIMKLVDFVVDEIDTTKLDTNLFESIVSKIVDKVDVTNSTEGLVVLNKARALTTSFVAADKLGMLSRDELMNIRSSMMC